MNNNDKTAQLISSDEAAKKNFTTDNVLQGSCVECGYQALIFYHYDDGTPVPEAPFLLIDSKKKELKGETDKNGMCLIESMPGGAFEVLFEEGSDTFSPKDTTPNNPALQNNEKYSAIAGEYFTLFVLLRDKGYLVYDADDSSDKHIDVDKGSFFQSIPEQYQEAYRRFWQLDEEINRGDVKLRSAINQVHTSLSAELASQAGDNSTILLFCQIALGFIPVVGQAMDLYDLGQWTWTTCTEEGCLGDPIHWAMGGLTLVGFVPGAGDAVKKTGQAVLKTIGKNTPEVIQKSVRILRGLSNGNLTKFLKKLIGELSDFAAKIDELLVKIIKGLEEALAKGANWIIKLLGDIFPKFISILKELSGKITKIFADIKKWIEEFINKITTRLTGTPYPKSSKNPKVDLEAGKSKDEVLGHKNIENKAKTDTANGKVSSESGTCINGCPIDMATGNVVEWRTDVEIVSALDLSMQRFYHSGEEHISGLLGTRWRSNWDMSLSLDKGIACLTDWKYSKAYYVIPTEEGEQTRAAHLPRWSLVRKEGVLELHEHNGLHYRFAYAMGTQLLLSHISDRFGQIHKFHYDRGVLKGISLNDGRVIKVTTRHRRIEKLTLHKHTGEQLSTLASYEYNKQGFLTACRAGVGRSFDYHYSKEGYLLRWQDLSQTWVEHDYDEKGRAIRSRGADNRFCDSLFYDDENKIVHYHSPLHGTKKYYRDALNNIVRIDLPNGEMTLNGWVNNQLVSTTDALGQTSVFSQDEFGNVTSVIAPDKSECHWQYDEKGRLTHFINELGNEWQITHDDQGNVIAVRDPLNGKTQFEYNQNGQCVCMTNADGVQTHYSFDTVLGLLSSIQKENKAPLNLRRDLLGRIFEASQGEQKHYWHYVGSSHLVSHISDKQNKTVQSFRYDIEGNVIESIDAKGQKYDYRYGAFDLLIEQINPLGQKHHYFYNGECQFAGLSNHKNEQWKYQFDTSGRIVKEIHLDGRQTSFGYDKANNLTHISRADGSYIEQSFDACQRIVSKTFYKSDGTIFDTHCFSYDQAGQLSRGSNRVSTVSFGYDAVGRLTKEQQNEHQLVHELSAAGNLIQSQGLLLALQQQWQGGELASIQLGNFAPLSFSYDSLGREITRQHQQGFSLQQEFNAEGLLAKQQVGRFLWRKNDVLKSQALFEVERRYGYDALGQLSTIADNHWGNTQYQHDALGQIVSESRSRPFQHSLGQYQEKRHFGYAAEQLTSIDKIINHSDGLSGELYQTQNQEKSLQYGSAGRVIKNGNTTLRYDSNGRLFEKITKDNGFRPKTTQYRWGETDELISVKLDNGDIWHYEYDVFGRRIRKYHSQQHATIKQAEIHYQWQGDQLSLQQKIYADGTIATTQWIYELDTFRPLAQARQLQHAANSGNEKEIELHFAVTDIGGNVRELCTPEGEIEWRGEPRLWRDFAKWRKTSKHKQYYEEAANEPLDCDLRFQGQVYDKESNLYYNRHRYYDPEICQYISPDPIGMLGGVNPQAYVHNPLEWVDPFGLSSCALSDAMEKNGTPRPKDSEAHHIVGETSQAAKPARDILNQYGLLNSAENGVFLPNRNNTDNMAGILHNGRHPDAYIGIVNERIINANILGGKEAVIKELSAIRNILSTANRDQSWETVLK